MSQPITIAFARGAPYLTVFAALFAVGAALAVWLVESRSSKPVPAAAAVVSGGSSEVTVEATYAVAAWSVLVDGVAVAATKSDARRWSGTIPAGRELGIEAQPADSLAGGAAALRAQVRQGARLRTVDAWGDGAAGLRIDLTAER